MPLKTFVSNTLFNQFSEHETGQGEPCEKHNHTNSSLPNHSCPPFHTMKVFNAAAAEPVDFECHLEGGQGTHFRVPTKVFTRVHISFVLPSGMGEALHVGNAYQRNKVIREKLTTT